MAAEGGGAGASLNDLLFDKAYRFEFFQAVRLLERIYPERQLVGRHDRVPAREVVRFRTRPTLHFPPSELYEITSADTGSDAAEDSPPPKMTVAFMGLTGPLGVLPSHITELVAERVRYKDTALWEFLDLFNHRFISLFYRAWERYRFTVAYERGAHDSFTGYLFNLVGMGTRGLKGRLGSPDEALLYYGGLIAQRPHSASATAAILGDYFGVPARLEPFTGQWLNLDDDSICRLGVANSELGFGTIVGTRVWDDQSKFRICFGALAFKEFSALLPSGADFRPAIELTRFIAGNELDFDVQLLLKREEAPACKLTMDDASRPQLGWTTWLKTRDFTQDAQVVLSPDSAVSESS